MKVFFPRVACCLLLLAVLAGCRMHTAAPRPTIPLVERVINDTQSAEYQFLSHYDPRDSRGDIVLLDIPDRCFYLSECLLNCDEYDNVDAFAAPDLLPDFAGERITSLIDLLYPPYHGFVSGGNTSALREITVRAALSAVDTACCLGPFDHEKRSVKPSAKLLVISSPYMAAYGGFDVDTLFRSTGSVAPVISVPEILLGKMMDRHEGAVNIGFLSDSLTASSGVYQEIFKEVARRRGDTYSTVFSFYVPGEAVPDSVSQTPASLPADLFKSILDQYSRSGKAQALTALIVDDFRVDVDSLQASYARILGMPSEENAFYRKMLSKGFEFISASRFVTDACFQYLRDHNLFTHNIAYPIASAYITSPESKGYLLMDFDVNALPPAMVERLQTEAPGTYKMYVQDQYHARGN